MPMLNKHRDGLCEWGIRSVPEMAKHDAYWYIHVLNYLNKV